MSPAHLCSVQCAIGSPLGLYCICYVVNWLLQNYIAEKHRALNLEILKLAKDHNG